MTETIEIAAEVEIDDVHVQMLERLRSELDAEVVETDLLEAAVSENQLQAAIYNGYRQLQNGP